MKAMILKETTDLRENKSPLELVDIAAPVPNKGEVLIRISVCGVCHTELDEIEGRTPPPSFPRVLGHQVVGTVEELGDKAGRFKIGDRVGVAWIYSSCGECRYCTEGNDNLCEDFKATGRDKDGGYAEYMTVSQNYAYLIPEEFTDSEAAPLLCAGAVGYRSLRLTGLKDGQNLGLTGFGASGHLVIRMAKHMFPNSNVYVFARNEEEREFSKQLGALWAGNTEDPAPQKLDAIIDTTPVWKPVVEALKNLNTEGRLVINAIRKEEVDKNYLLNLDYSQHLWMEKEIKSVANVSRKDVIEFLELAARIPIKPEIEEYALEDANKALIELKEGKIKGAKVLVIDK
ncbi:MAG: zinc-binding alcohol dehydrogenase family protein [Candidatus Dadabacteria bacterium]|nr:MAG: zinc-binding alcohol dehydrogenase family protein [Candidatus Dadabacteria bacterium]